MSAKTMRIIFWLAVLFITVIFVLPAIKNTAGIHDFENKLDSMLPKARTGFNFTSTVLGLMTLIDPKADPVNANAELGRMAGDLKPSIDADYRPDSVMKTINNYLFKKKGYVFDGAANALMMGGDLSKLSAEDFRDFNSIDRVLSRKKGICLSLSLIYLIIADKLNLPIYGVLVPGHIFVRWDEPGHSEVNAETTFGGVEYYGYGELTKSEFIDKDKVIYNKPLDRYDTIAAMLNNFGVLMIRTGNIRKARIMLERSIAMLPDFPETHNNLGLIYLVTGKTGMAEDEFKRSIELFPNNSSAYTNLGAVYLVEKRYTLSQDSLEKALKLEPNNARARDILVKLVKERGQ